MEHFRVPNKLICNLISYNLTPRAMRFLTNLHCVKKKAKTSVLLDTGRWYDFTHAQGESQGIPSLCVTK